MKNLIEKMIADDPTNGACHLIATAYDMRNAQKDYFQTRTYDALQLSKRLEKQFDEELKRFLQGYDVQETTLFDNGDAF